MAAMWEELFDELVELSVEERAARLAAIAAWDPDLGRRLSELLAADARSTERLLRPVLDGSPGFVSAAFDARPAVRDRAGERVGRYRLVSLLGRGGMGEVWLAERADGEFESRVALKLIRSGGGSEGILARFLRERQILARLDHPGIARLLDGGRGDDGEPYFVLDYVDGTPITEWCAARSLSIDDRVRRLVEVCAAVDHAHRSLIVHRDLKPSNILVDRQGRTKLLDFGVAKLVEPEGGPVAEDSRTRLEGTALTPAYAAPEQILGEPVTTATDVYALGVLLYELLTGDHPHLRRQRSFAALVQEVETETVERPSVRVRREASSGTGPADRRRIARRAARLEGDLDAIVGRALARAPQRRYPSAAALGDDLERFLDGRPVRAGRTAPATAPAGSCAVTGGRWRRPRSSWHRWPRAWRWPWCRPTGLVARRAGRIGRATSSSTFSARPIPAGRWASASPPGRCSKSAPRGSTKSWRPSRRCAPTCSTPSPRPSAGSGCSSRPGVAPSRRSRRRWRSTVRLRHRRPLAASPWPRSSTTSASWRAPAASWMPPPVPSDRRASGPWANWRNASPTRASASPGSRAISRPRSPGRGVSWPWRRPRRARGAPGRSSSSSPSPAC